MGAPITTGLEPIIEALRACRAELADDNTRAEQIEHARAHLAECEARLASYPAAPTAHKAGCVIRLANWMRGRDPLVADVRAAREYLDNLQTRREFAGYETPEHEDDETHEREDFRTWQEIESERVGIPMRGEI